MAYGPNHDQDIQTRWPVEADYQCARYEFAEVESPGLAGELDRFLARLKPGR